MLRVYPKCNQTTAIQFLDYLLEQLPFRVESVQTDNGAEFQSGFHWHVLDRGIQHAYIKPATPRLNGKVERSHRIDQEESSAECSTASSSTTPTCSTTNPRQWEDYHNFNRPHGALDGQTPVNSTDRACRPFPGSLNFWPLM